MKPLPVSALRLLLAAVLLSGAARAEEVPGAATWKETHDRLVLRLRNLAARENAFGPAYRPLYHAALPWYELWGGRDENPVDKDMVAPEAYAAELAASLEEGRNYFAENPDALFPLAFSATLPGGRQISANYWLSLPKDFPTDGRTFPIVVDLHGSGWLGHKISFKRGSGSPGPVFGVTPINMGGPWQIDFLNAYLDAQMAILPIDRDRVYVQGHSLGGMATWEWALANPERFAAISPRAGIGEPYRSIRLKNVPAWVIHGENDNVIPSGFADQMVTALQAQGSGVRFSLIKGGEHNMPPDLDQGQVLEWYLRQTRSHLAPPADPREALGLTSAGFSPWQIIALSDAPSWRSQPMDLSKGSDYRDAAAVLFRKAHDRGELVDSPIRREWDPRNHLTTLWLAVPRTLHPAGVADPSAVAFPAMHVLRFYYRGETQRALDHLQSIRAEAEESGHALSGNVWITALSIAWQESPDVIAEYWAEIK